MRTELAAAIAEIKELYERESAGVKEPIAAPERDRDLPQQRADKPEPAAARMAAEGARARDARAFAAVASEQEKRFAAEVELDRLRAEVEGERERTREALQEAKAASERWQRAEAEVIELRREIEVRHHQAEEMRARLVEEADSLGQRLQAAEMDVAELRQAESARQLFRRRPVMAAATTSILLGIAVTVLSAYLLSLEPAKDRIISAVATMRASWVAAKEKIVGKIQPTTTTANPAPQSAAPDLGAQQPRTVVATPLESGRGIQIPSQAGSTFTAAQQDRGTSSQLRPQISGDQQQPTPVAPVQDKVPEGNFAAPTSASADAPSEVGHIQPQASDSVPRKEQTDVTQENARAGVALPQRESTPVGDEVAPSPPSRLPTASTSSPTNEASITTAVAAHVSIHYRQGSPSGRADAERVATWLVSSGFGAPQLLISHHVPTEQVVRYFFVEDAEATNRIVGELRKRGGKWRAEDCTHYRRKPLAGTIQVWSVHP